MPTCRWWRLTYTRNNPQYHGQTITTQYQCTTPVWCKNNVEDSRQGGCQTAGQITSCPHCGCTEFTYHADRRAYPAGTFLTPMTDQGGDVVWMYNQDKGIFESYGIPWLKEQLYNILGEKCAHRHQAEVVNLLKTATYIHPEEFIETPEIVVLKNGCYNLYTGKLEPFKIGR